MAIAVRLHAPTATREQFNALDDALGNWSSAHGGPPDGFVSYTAFADGEGFSVFLVWRNADLWQRCWDGVMLGLFRDAGIAVDQLGHAPVWGLAK